MKTYKMTIDVPTDIRFDNHVIADMIAKVLTTEYELPIGDFDMYVYKFKNGTEFIGFPAGTVGKLSDGGFPDAIQTKEGDWVIEMSRNPDAVALFKAMEVLNEK